MSPDFGSLVDAACDPETGSSKGRLISMEPNSARAWLTAQAGGSIVAREPGRAWFFAPLKNLDLIHRHLFDG